MVKRHTTIGEPDVYGEWYPQRVTTTVKSPTASLLRFTAKLSQSSARVFFKPTAEWAGNYDWHVNCLCGAGLSVSGPSARMRTSCAWRYRLVRTREANVMGGTEALRAKLGRRLSGRW